MNARKNPLRPAWKRIAAWKTRSRRNIPNLCPSSPCSGRERLSRCPSCADFCRDNDREVRKAAASAIGKALQSGRERLDDIFDRLVKVRTKIAQKLGYKNFVELGYYRMERIDYDRAMVEQFRKNVQQDLVPAIAKLKEEVAQELKLGKLYFYDDQIYNANGEPRPFGNTQQIMAAAQEMYDEMHPALGSCMRLHAGKRGV